MRKPWLAPVLIALMLAGSGLAFPHLPNEIPTHWDFAGEADGFTARWPGAFLFSAIALGIWLLLLFLPRIDPRRAHYERFRDTYWLIVNLIVALMGLFQLISFGQALGWPIAVPGTVMGGLGLLLVALGNYLPRIRSNWWIGIRTPWTLESESVWKATHRIAGRCFVAVGILVWLGALGPQGLRAWLGGAALVLAVVVPFVFSYLAYRREAGGEAGT